MRTMLRSKVTLLFIVCAALLAFGGTAMAITADPSGTTATSPTITSDKADYAPGELVTLTGGGWQPGESVNIKVNDTYGASWSRNVDVTADASGNVTDSFNLPNAFVSDYDVTATGAQSGTATTTFTDGNLASVSGTVTDGASATNAGLSGATVTCDTSTGCNGTFTTTTDASGNYVFDNTTTKLSFAGNSATLSLKVTATGYTAGTISLGSVSNGDTLTGKNVTLNPSCTNPAAPVFQNTANANGWFTSTTTPNATTTTSGATVKYSSSETGTYSTTPPPLGEGTATVWAKAFSSTGTCSSAAVSMVFKVDTIAPSVNPASVTDGTWRNTSLSQAFTASDNGSGLATPADASFTLTASAESLDANTPTVVSKTVSDVAGNSTTRSVSAKIDLTPPSVSASLDKTAASTGWFNLATGAPTVSFTCSDGLSGLASTCPSPYLFGNGENQSRSSGDIFDNAGNKSSAGVQDVDVDLSKPTNINFQGGPAAGQSYDFGSAIPAAPTCSADDTFSGMPANGGCAVTGYSTAVGTHTLLATATDIAGNSDTATRSYTVSAANASGFYSPVDMGGVLNTGVKAGSTIPVKFELFGGASKTEQKTTGAVGSMTARQVSCGAFTGAPTDNIEYLAPTSENTGLRFDLTGDQFIYNWKTPKQAGCYSLTMTAADNTTTLVAYFQLK